MVAQRPQKQVGLLLVLHPAFFCARNKHGAILPEWSRPMLQEADRIWEHTLVLEEWRGVWSQRPKLKLRSELFTLGLSTVEAVHLDGMTTLEQVELTKRCIIEYGGKIRSAENPHDITVFNIDHYIDAPHFTCVGADDHVVAGIKLDKPLNFKEMAAKREARTIW